jgi:acyl-CoA thioesterase FadM
MPRLSLDLPEHFGFSTEIMVYVSHVNAQLHVDNAQMLGLVGEARARFYAHHGYTELDAAGFNTAVADVLWLYRGESFHGDVLRFDVTAADPNPYGFDLVYRATRILDDREVGRGKHGMVFIDPATRRIAPMPPAFWNRVSAA